MADPGYIDRTTLTNLNSNLVASTTSSAAKLKAAVGVLFDQSDANWGSIAAALSGLISADTYAQLGLVNVKASPYNANNSALATTGSMTTGTKVLTLADAKDFADGDEIRIVGTPDLQTSIVSGGGTTTLTLADTATVTYTDAAVKHDATIAIQAAIDSAVTLGKSEVYLPNGTYNYGTLTSTSGLTFIGDGVTLNGTTAISLVSLAALKAETAIEPDSLRTSDTETDGDLLQKAIDACSGDDRQIKNIKLSRLYDIDKTILVSGTTAPFVLISGNNGGLRNMQDNPMFKGEVSGSVQGGLYFQNVKFQGSGSHITSPYFDLGGGTDLIALVFDGCQFMSTPTILKSTGFIQSCRFVNCNFKNMKDTQIEADRVYDMTLHNNLVEFGDYGFIHLTNTGSTLDDYCCYNLRITDNVMESILEESPIQLTSVASCLIQGNYFEGNVYYDIDLSGGDLEHQQLSIRNNFFGSMALDGEGDVISRDGAVNVGKIFTTTLKGNYDFTNNTGMGAVIFKFLNATAARNINMSKSLHLGADASLSNLDHKGFYGQQARKTLSLDTGSEIFTYALYNETLATITRKVFFVELYYNNTTVTDSVSKTVGWLYVIPTTKTGLTGSQLKLIFKPLFIYNGATQETASNGLTDSSTFCYFLWNSNSSQFRDSISGSTILSDSIKITADSPHDAIQGFITEMPFLVGY